MKMMAFVKADAMPMILGEFLQLGDSGLYFKLGNGKGVKCGILKIWPLEIRAKLFWDTCPQPT